MSYLAKRTKGAADQPLFLTFHGTGGTEDQFHGFAETLLPGAHVTSPRGDVSEHGALRYFRRTGEGVYDMDDLAVRANAMADFIRAEKSATGANQTAGLGYSNGANILAAVALDQPDLVDDLILMHPLIPWAPAPQPGLAGRRILITAGQRDPICPAPMTQALTDYLMAQGATVTLHWHPGGHEIAQSEVDVIRDFIAASSSCPRNARQRHLPSPNGTRLRNPQNGHLAVTRIPCPPSGWRNCKVSECNIRRG